MRRSITRIGRAPSGSSSSSAAPRGLAVDVGVLPGERDEVHLDALALLECLLQAGGFAQVFDQLLDRVDRALGRVPAPLALGLLRLVEVPMNIFTTPSGPRVSWPSTRGSCSQVVAVLAVAVHEVRELARELPDLVVGVTVGADVLHQPEDPAGETARVGEQQEQQEQRAREDRRGERALLEDGANAGAHLGASPCSSTNPSSSSPVAIRAGASPWSVVRFRDRLAAAQRLEHRGTALPQRSAARLREGEAREELAAPGVEHGELARSEVEAQLGEGAAGSGWRRAPRTRGLPRAGARPRARAAGGPRCSGRAIDVHHGETELGLGEAGAQGPQREAQLQLVARVGPAPTPVGTPVGRELVVAPGLALGGRDLPGRTSARPGRW